MKINEKHLCVFATGSAATDKHGYLMKRGEGNRAFQKRWFVLKGNLLFYMEKPTDRDPIGVVVLEDCTVEVSESETDAYSFELSFGVADARTYVLAASTQEEMEDWMKQLTCATYEYTRRMVTELQGQLDALNAAEASTDNHHHHTASSVVQRSSIMTTDKSKAVVQPAVGKRDTSASTKPLIEFETDASSCARGGAMMDSKAAECNGALCAEGARQNVRTFEKMHEEFGSYIADCVGSVARPSSNQ